MKNKWNGPCSLYVQWILGFLWSTPSDGEQSVRMMVGQSGCTAVTKSKPQK